MKYNKTVKDDLLNSFRTLILFCSRQLKEYQSNHLLLLFPISFSILICQYSLSLTPLNLTINSLGIFQDIFNRFLHQYVLLFLFGSLFFFVTLVFLQNIYHILTKLFDDLMKYQFYLLEQFKIGEFLISFYCIKNYFSFFQFI